MKDIPTFFPRKTRKKKMRFFKSYIFNVMATIKNIKNTSDQNWLPTYRFQVFRNSLNRNIRFSLSKKTMAYVYAIVSSMLSIVDKLSVLL